MKGMRVDGLVSMLMKNSSNKRIVNEALQQVANVAHLPGIVKHSLAMPDLHWGLRICHRWSRSNGSKSGWRCISWRELDMTSIVVSDWLIRTNLDIQAVGR